MVRPWKVWLMSTRRGLGKPGQASGGPGLGVDDVWVGGRAGWEGRGGGQAALVCGGDGRGRPGHLQKSHLTDWCRDKLYIFRTRCPYCWPGRCVRWWTCTAWRGAGRGRGGRACLPAGSGSPGSAGTAQWWRQQAGGGPAADLGRNMWSGERRNDKKGFLVFCSAHPRCRELCFAANLNCPGRWWRWKRACNRSHLVIE